jgi:hypothetical protein
MPRATTTEMAACNPRPTYTIVDGDASAPALGLQVCGPAVAAVGKGSRCFGRPADRVCGKRLKAAIPVLVDSMERHGHLKLDEEVRRPVLAASAATIDRVLAPARDASGQGGEDKV